jgi:RNA polymerase sigma-70 factor (ECF subfamily)
MTVRRAEAPTARTDPVAVDTFKLLDAVAQGDEVAFAKLYDLVAPRVYGLVRSVLTDAAHVEAVVRETFVEVWRTAARYDANVSAIAWILTVAHRKAVDRARLTPGAVRQHRSPVPGSERARRCLEALTRLEREAFVLSYYQGHTYREVAGLLDTDVPVIKLRLRDGLIRMRDCLGLGAGSEWSDA